MCCQPPPCEGGRGEERNSKWRTEPSSPVGPPARLSREGRRPGPRSLLPCCRQPQDASSCSARDWASRRPTIRAALTRRSKKRSQGQKCSQPARRLPGVYKRRAVSPGRKCRLGQPPAESLGSLEPQAPGSEFRITVPRGPGRTKGERVGQTLW